MNLPKIIITDIDGVWTDGGMYYDQSGNEWKKFNTSDSAGVLWCRFLEIPVVIVTGEDTEIVRRRAQKLKIEHAFHGIKDKVQTVDKLLQELKFSWEEVAFIGDDINDYHMLKKVGFSCCPANSPSYIKSIVDHVVDVKGGDGAFRAFVEHIMVSTGNMEKVLEKYLSNSTSKLNQ